MGPRGWAWRALEAPVSPGSGALAGRRGARPVRCRGWGPVAPGEADGSESIASLGQGEGEEDEPLVLRNPLGGGMVLPAFWLFTFFPSFPFALL